MPQRRRQPATPARVDAITHTDKRANIPTADAQDFIQPELEHPITLHYPRDPSLDPQLVWKNKDCLDAEDLLADAPAIYIQEKIDPRALIEGLRRSPTGSSDHQLNLFDSFDGLPELDLVEWYRHEANWSNRMILGDSLNVMASLAEREALRGKVQMIYVDPPYGIKFGSNWQATTRKRDIKDGKLADATREVEQIRAFRDTWELGIHSYLAYLRDRLTVAKDLLTDSGSAFVQIGDENVHLVRSLMDEVFGSDNFVSLITFRTSVPLRSTGLAGIADFLLWYAKDHEVMKFRDLFVGRELGEGTVYTSLQLADGTRRKMTAEERLDPSRVPEGSRIYCTENLASSGYTPTCTFPFDYDGRRFIPTSGKSWKTNKAGMEALAGRRRLDASGATLRYVLFADDYPVMKLTNLWTDTKGETDKTYVVQTNTKIIQRCMLMATDPGDLVLDPTCGSGTTAYVAEQWGRRWITIDTSRVALALARQRMVGSSFSYHLLADSAAGRSKAAEITRRSLPPAETTNDVRHGFVYERALHITLKAIAGNPDIKEGMSHEEIDAAIRRHAEFELLYDKPYLDLTKVRVAGPFTVESLSPHRSLAFAGSAVDSSGSLNGGEVTNASNGDSSFEQMILANLRTAGIQNGRKGERLNFDSVEPYASLYIQAVGERGEVTDGSPRRVGITIGPQYGTVGPSFIKEAAREANRAAELDLLCVLAFAFDPVVLPVFRTSRLRFRRPSFGLVGGADG